jgi:tetratricopeptide (TPR) repeat protein
MGRSGAVSAVALLAALGALAIAGPQAVAQSAAPAAKPAVARGADPAKLILAGDLDGFLGQVRTSQAQTRTVSGAVVLAVDALGRGDTADAIATVDALPRRSKQSVSDLIQMWTLLQQGDAKAALARAKEAQTRLSPGLGGLAPALVLESSGDLNGAATAYADYLGKMDTAPLPEGGPRDAATLQRILESPRVAQAIYRAALVNHRLGKRDEGMKYYLLSEQFTPGAPDVADNLARLKAGQMPREPALNARSGLGRWMMFVSIEYQIARAKAGAAGADDSKAPVTVVSALEKYSGPVFAELGLRLDPSADDWRVSAADDLVASGGVPAAEKLLAGLPAGSPFAAEAKLTLARIALTKKADAEAVNLVHQALSAANGRYSIELDGGRALSLAGRDEEAIATLDKAVAAAPDGADRAEALLARAGAKFQAGRLAEAGLDAREALKANDSERVQMGAVGYLSMTEDGWYESIRIAREVLFSRPRSIDAMNALGYALIQREQGLDEGFKVLSRGVAQQPDYYPIVDSLGWAYYQYGDFESARELVAQANEMTKSDPNPEILDHLGDIYWRLSKPSDARKTWSQALVARPDGARKADLEKKIRAGLAGAAPAKRAPPRIDLRPFQSDGDQTPI